MWRSGESVFLEPEELAALARALQDEARALLALGGDSAIRGLAIREIQRTIEALLHAERRPAVYVLQEPSAAQLAAYRRHLADR